MDMDGANVKYLDGGKDLGRHPALLAFRPRKSPTCRFGGGDPKVTLLNLDTTTRSVGNFPGILRATVSRRRQQIALSLSDAAPTFTRWTLRSRATTRLTEGSAIDTSRLHPTVRRSRLNRPWRLAADLFDERERRRGQAYFIGERPLLDAGLVACAAISLPSPASKAARFGIGVMKPDGSASESCRRLPQRPTFAPNGLYLMFFRDAGGAGGPKLYMTAFLVMLNLVPTPNYEATPPGAR